MLIPKQKQLHGRNYDGIDSDVVVQGLRVGGSFLNADAVSQTTLNTGSQRVEQGFNGSLCIPGGTSNKSNMTSRTRGQILSYK